MMLVLSVPLFCILIKEKETLVLIYPNRCQSKVKVVNLFGDTIHKDLLFKVYFGEKLKSFSVIIRTKCVPVMTPGQMLENWNSRALIRTSGHSRCFTLPTQMLQSVASNVVHRALYWKKISLFSLFTTCKFVYLSFL